MGSFSRFGSLATLVLGLAGVLCTTGASAAGRVYFVNYTQPQIGIWRINTDGSGLQAVIPDIGPWGGDYSSLAVEGGRIYWPWHAANTDGTGFEELDNLPGTLDGQVSGIAYDRAGNAYVPVPTPNTGGTISIFRDDPGPNPPELFIGNLPFMYLGLAMDPVHDQLYWTGSWDQDASGVIQRVNLDGTGLETLVTSEHLQFTDERHCLALDVDGGKMYWTRFGTIRRANLDGSDVEDFLTGFSPMAIAVEVPEPAGLMVVMGAMFVVGRRCQRRVARKR